MAHEISDLFNADTSSEKSHCKRVPKTVKGGFIEGKTTEPYPFFVDKSDGLGTKRSPRSADPQKEFGMAGLRPVSPHIALDQSKGCPMQGENERGMGFSLVDPEDSGPPVDRIEGQGGDLRRA